MDLKLSVALIIGQIISFLTKIRGGGATAAPGLYALRIDPLLVQKLTKKIPNGNIVISGTNGKTTTARLGANILSTEFRLIHNRQGSNLLRGIASTLISGSNIFGKSKADIGIWEIDEATLPEAIDNINPDIVVLLNLFRDQLDRYGEVDNVRAKWRKSLSKLGKNTILILNADDPGISILAKEFKGRVIFFGVEEKALDLPPMSQVADISHCLNCGNKLTYSSVLSAHMGHYACSKCNFKRPTPNISASKLVFKPDFSTSTMLNIYNSRLQINYQLPGLYNVYNILAAFALGNSFKIDHAKIKGAISGFSAAFGRFQKIEVEGKNITIFLIKNPAGANEVLRTLSVKKDLNILALLNDKIADGRDVSWIWDTNWEILVPQIKNLAISGTRCWDMAARIKYADFKLSKNNVYENINYSIEKSLKTLDKKDTLIILPTYTAMLSIQNYLNRKGVDAWHNQ